MGSSLVIIAFGLLVVRSAYWVFAVWEKGNPGMKVFLGQIGELILLFFILTQIGIWRVLPIPQSFLNSVFGFVLVVGGIVMSFVGKMQLGVNWQYAGSNEKPEKLVTSGIYRYIRHPIYVGYIVSFVGIEFMIGSYLWISSLGLFIPFYLQAKKEEKLLGRIFGGKFGYYKKRTKLFLPYLW